MNHLDAIIQTESMERFRTATSRFLSFAVLIDLNGFSAGVSRRRTDEHDVTRCGERVQLRHYLASTLGMGHPILGHAGLAVDAAGGVEFGWGCCHNDTDAIISDHRP